MCGDVERNVDEFLFQGSGWIVNRPLYMEAEFTQCKPLSGRGCGLHSAIYMRNMGITYATDVIDDNGNCFYYAIAASFLGRKANLLDLKKFISEELVLLDKVNYFSINF